MAKLEGVKTLDMVNGEITKVSDDTNEHHVWDYDGMFAIFRKVAASTNPSVEERVAKAEGEIDSLKSDVAALKGEAEYKRKWTEEVDL